MPNAIQRACQRSLALALALLTAGTAAGAAAPAPKWRASDIGKEIEKGLGKMVADEIEAEYGVVDDPLLNDWVDRVGQRLAAVSGRTDVKYRFKVLDSDDVNAVAAPGGYIYVNRGTLRFIHSEDELAAVMGHEVGHVAGKHGMKQFNAQILGTLALLGFQSIHANTLSTVGSLAGGLAMLKFSRDEENDADRRGLRNATATGYDGGAMIAFFERLEATEKEKPSSLEVYFLTHPPTPERIRRIAREPGTAETSANFAALGDGLAARSLFREAADAYRRALKLDPANADLKRRLADAFVRAPQTVRAAPLTAEGRASRLAQVESFGGELDAARDQLAGDFKKLSDTQRDVDTELELAARSLSSAAQMIRRDTFQYHQFERMARSFDQAARIGGNLRASRETAETTLDELTRLRADMRHAIESGDGAAAREVDSLLLVSPQMLQDLTGGLRQSRSRAGDARSAAHTLHIAADTLLNSLRGFGGFTSLSGGQYNILDLQVSTAQDSLRDGVTETHKALAQVARARMESLERRIDFLTRAIAPDDPATLGIFCHYLGVEPEQVRETRARLDFGQSALALAQDRMEQIAAAKRTARIGKDGRPKPSAARDRNEAAPTVRPENASVLFGLIAHDLERETAAQ